MVFVDVHKKINREFAVVETLMKIVMMNVNVYLLTPETLMVHVVVKKLILSKLVLMHKVMQLGLIVNVMDLCRQV